MKKTTFTIKEFQNPNHSHSITLSNIGVNQDNMQIILCIIEKFINESELFFGGYKTDGFYLSKSEKKKYSVEIPTFFQTNGIYHNLKEKKSKYRNPFLSKHELVACRIQATKAFYEIIDKIFHFYLETIFFCPKIDWETFIASYKDYTNITISDYVMNGYTDFLFSYTDSEDFCITFNPKLHSPKTIRNQINQIISKQSL